MSGGGQAAARPVYQQVLGLVEQLAGQREIDAQRALIAEMAARLVQGQADLWLAETPYALSDLEDVGVSPAEPTSDLMRRALDVGQVLVSPAEVKRPPVAGEGELDRDVPAVAIPLRAHDTVLGVLEVQRPGGPSFSDGEIELLSGLVAQSAIALHAARQVAIERWRIEQLCLVREVSAQVADVFDLGELARRVTDLILRTFGCYYVALFILDSGDGILRCEASAGPAGHWPNSDGQAPVLEVRLEEGIIGSAAQAGVEIVANDVSRELRYRYVETLPDTRSELALPLKIEARVLGVLDVQSVRTDVFDEASILVLRALADNVAMAVEHSRLYSNLRRRADQLSAVADVSRAVASILDLDTLLEEVVDLIHRQFGYTFVYLFIIDPARQQISCRAGIGSSAQEWEMEQWVCDLDHSEGIVPWVARHGETVLCGDTSRDPRCQPSGLPPHGTRSELAVPLVFGDQVLGVLNVRSDRRDAFGDEDRFLFEALADSVATAIRNANLYRSERWRRQVSDSLREVAGLLSSEVALDQVLDTILAELERTLPCDVAAIWLLNNGSLCLSAVRGDMAEVCVDAVSPDDDSWLGEALSAGQPIIRTSESPPEPLGSALEFPADYSAITAPLRVGDQRLGVLTLAHRTSGRYGTESQMITAAFASHAAVAIENARLYQEAQELAQISTVMLQVAEATRSLVTLDQVLDTVAHLVPTLVGVDRCAILLWDDFEAAFVPAAASGLAPAQQATFEEWTIALGDEPAFDDLRRNHMPIFVYDVMTDPRLSDLVVWDLGFESLLLLPLLAQDEVQGVMLIDYRTDWFEFDGVGGGPVRDERLVIIQGVALQTAAAVENTGLRQSQREEAYVSAALLQVAQAVANLNDLDAILSTIVRITPILVGVERCAIFVWDDVESVFRLAQAYGVARDAQATLLTQRYAIGDFPLLDTVRECDCHLVYPPGRATDAHQESTSEKGEEYSGDSSLQVPPEFVASFFPPSADLTENAEGRQFSLLAVPLSVKGDVLGVMVLEEAGAPGPFRQRTEARRMEIIAGIAHQAGLAVQSDLLQQEMAERERLERELQLAHEIQQTFMPGQWLDLPGWDLAFAWRAARQVAGDFYDFFELPGGRLGLVIADVADKGMPAALFMALTRTLVRAAALEEISPAAAMARVNDLLVPDAQSGMFVTAVYAVLSLETAELTYVHAGHNLPLLLRSRTGELERFRKGGMALGVLEGVQLEEHIVSLETGDTLVFYTDGITEAFSPEGEDYGEERLRAAIQAAAGGSAQVVLDSIDDSVDAFIGDGDCSDDRTLMVLHRLE